MAGQRPLTQDELDWYKSQGIDATGATATMEVPEQEQQNSKEQPSVGKTIADTAEAHAGGYAGGAGLMALGPGRAIGMGLGALTGPFAEFGIPIGGIIGSGVDAAAGSYAGQELQRKVGGEAQKKLEEEAQTDAASHPYVAGATDIAGSALVGGGWPSFRNLGRAGEQLLGRNALSEEADIAAQKLGLTDAISSKGAEQLAAQTGGKEALAKVAGAGTVNAALNAGIGVATGHTPTLSGMLTDFGAGALFSEQSALGRAMHGGAHEEPLPETNDKTTPQSDTGATPETTSVYTQKDENGNYTISDNLIKQDYLANHDKIWSKAELAKMSPEDALRARQENANTRNLAPDVMRSELHNDWLSSESTKATPVEGVKMPVDQSTVAPVIAEPTEPTSDLPNAKAEQKPTPQEASSNELAKQQEGNAVLDAAQLAYEREVRANGLNSPKLPELFQKLQESQRRAEDHARALQELHTQSTEANPAPVGTVPPLNENSLRIIDPKTLLPQLTRPTVNNEEGAIPFKPGVLPQADSMPTEAERIQDEWDKGNQVHGAPPSQEEPYNSKKTLNNNDIETNEETSLRGTLNSKFPGWALSNGERYLPDGSLSKGYKDEPEYQDLLSKYNKAVTDRFMSPFKEGNDIAEHIKTGNATVGSVLKMVSNSSIRYNKLAKAILEVSHQDKLNDRVLSGWPNKRAAYHTDSTYKGGTKSSIILDSNRLNNIDTIMHEAIHAVTSNNLPTKWAYLKGASFKKAMDDYLSNPKSDPSIKELIRCYYEAAKQLGVEDDLFGERGTASARPDETADRIRYIGDGLAYGMANLHEFMAQIANSTQFQHTLNILKSGLNDGKSLWNRLVDGIRSLYKLPINENSLLNRALKATEGIASTKRPTASDILDEFQTHNAPLKDEEGKVTPKVNRMGKLGGVTEPLYDRIARLGHHAAQAVSDAFKLTDNTKEQYIGESWNRIKQVMDKTGFTKQDGKQLDKVEEWENRNHQAAPLSMFRTRAQRAVYNIEREVYDLTGKRRLANNEPVYRNGTPTKLQQDPFSHPTPLAPKIAETLKQGTDMGAIAKLQKDYVDNATSYGKTPEQAQAMWQELRDTISGNMSKRGPNMSFFGGARLSQGTPLPRSFTPEGYANRKESYYKRQALDNAFYKHVESNPTVMSALGESKDAWGNVIPKDKQGSIAGNKDVNTALEQFKGETLNPFTKNEASITNLASTLFVSSPVIEMHKIASNVINGALALSDNPIQALRTATHMITGISAGIEHAQENGVLKMTARSVSNFFDNNATLAERVQALSQGYRNLSSLGGRTDKWNMGLMQAGFESALPAKVAKANRGDTTAQQLIKKFDPDYKVGKEYDTEGIQKLASLASNYVHGTRDGRTMPPFMLSDSELSGFFKLAHWSISQTNRFMSDIWTPATKGNLKPLIVGLLGSTIGGYIIREEREMMQGKHGDIPDLKEIQASQGGLAGNKGMVAYNIISAMQYAGFAGILSQGVKYPVDRIMKNTPQGAVFPLDEIATDLTEQIGNFISAKANDPNFDIGHAAIQLMNHIWTTDVQLSRIGFNQGVNAGLITGTQAEKKILSDKLGQLRRFDMVSNLPYDDQEPSQANSYMNIEQRNFKMEQNLPKAMSQLPSLVESIVKTYADRPDVMMSKFKALKENSYETFPSLEDKAPSFAKYMTYLSKLKSPADADKEYMDYMQHKIVNEVKASAVP